MALISGAAQAETLTNRTSDYAISFSDPTTFSGASALYGLSFAYDAQPAFSSSVFNLTLNSDFQNLNFQNGGGITTSTSPQPPYSSPVPVTISGDGTAGFWGATYNTGLAGGLLTLGTQGGLTTLEFNGAGTVANSTGYTNIGYYIFVHLPGNWTTAGTSTGDYQINSLPSDSNGHIFPTPTFTYNSGTTTTTVETLITNYTGPTATNLDFTLFGGPAVSETPLPAALPLFATGLGALGLLGWRRKQKKSAA